MGIGRGLRTDLHDHGIDIGLRLSQYGQGVASGGVQKSFEYGARMGYRVHADLAKAVGTWEGLSIDLHAMTRFGEDILAGYGWLGASEHRVADASCRVNTATRTLPGSPSTSIFRCTPGTLGLATLGKLDVIDAVSLFFPTVNHGQEGFLERQRLGQRPAVVWRRARPLPCMAAGWRASMRSTRSERADSSSPARIM